MEISKPVPKAPKKQIKQKKFVTQANFKNPLLSDEEEDSAANSTPSPILRPLRPFQARSQFRPRASPRGFRPRNFSTPPRRNFTPRQIRPQQQPPATPQQEIQIPPGVSPHQLNLLNALGSLGSLLTQFNQPQQ